MKPNIKPKSYRNPYTGRFMSKADYEIMQKDIKDPLNAKLLADPELLDHVLERYISDKHVSQLNNIKLKDLGYKQEQIDFMERQLKKSNKNPNWLKEELDKINSMSDKEFIEWSKSHKSINVTNRLKKMKMFVPVAAVVASQSPTFATKKDVYDSIPSTKSSGVMSRATNPETFKNGVVNMARTMDASAKQISKLLKMDAKLLEELYYDKPFLFDLYFEYSLYDDFGSSHEDSGINKLIESYEYKYGVTL